MGTQVKMTLNEAELRVADSLVGYRMRRDRTHTGVGYRTSRQAALMWAAEQTHKTLADEIDADERAWSELVEIAGAAAMLTVRGRGSGEPIPEERRESITADGRKVVSLTPPRWRAEQVAIEATLEGEPLDARLIVLEDMPLSGMSFNVFFVGDSGKGRVLIGSLSRNAEDPSSPSDNRLFRIAEENGFDYLNVGAS